ncbi:MAG: pilus assembly protein TadG-related protein [Candidatus Omnitrophota bacterium]
MNIIFHRIRRGEKGQIASVLVIILVVFIILAFITVNLGQISLKRTNSSNASDAAALAAGSIAAALLNDISSFNEQMMINFAGFSVMMLLNLAQLIYDIGMLIAALLDPTGVGLLLAVANVVMDSLSAVLLTSGAINVGKTLEGMITQTNERIPEDTRDTAKQYAFNNLNIDEPRITYREWQGQEGNTDKGWDDYLKETRVTFSEFMRREDYKKGEFANNNLARYSWKEKRGLSEEYQTSQSAEVEVEPLSKLTLDTIKFREIATYSKAWDAINAGTMAMSGQPVLQVLFSVAVLNAPLIATYIVLAQTLFLVLLAIIAVVLAVRLIELAMLIGSAGIFALIGIEFLGLDKDKIKKIIRGLRGAAKTIKRAMNSLWHLDWLKLPCFIQADVDGDGQGNMDAGGLLFSGGTPLDLQINVEIRRTTSPAERDYGLWKMKSPRIVSASTVKIEGGHIFPARTGWDARIVGAR